MIADIGTYFYENDTSVTKQSHTKESDSGTNFVRICFKVQIAWFYWENRELKTEKWRHHGNKDEEFLLNKIGTKSQRMEFHKRFADCDMVIKQM